MREVCAKNIDIHMIIKMYSRISQIKIRAYLRTIEGLDSEMIKIVSEENFPICEE